MSCSVFVVFLNIMIAHTIPREKSKQLAEQSAAVSCLIANEQDDGRLVEPPHETEELRRKWRHIINSNENGEDDQTQSSVTNGHSENTDSSQLAPNTGS